MILFCEECGQRNSITLTPSLIENNSFTCQFCGFHSPFPFLDQNRQSTGSNPGITWEPEFFRLGPEAKHEEQRFQLIFKVAEIQTPELSVAPFHDFSHLISVEKIASDSFTVIIHPLETDNLLYPGFNHPVLIYCEEHLMTWGTINIAYEQGVEQHVDVPAEENRAAESKKQDIPPPAEQEPEKEQHEHYEVLHQQLAEYKTQLHQAKTTSYRLQKELSIRRQVMDNQDCGILFINLELRIVYANPVFLKRTGYSLKAIQSKR
ncbi:MAG: hypothetical protein D3904_13130, partial [Candidatus Electrothrix sp. EH2]|nr:hypothetical protein [Candidatus Electrothrix sp. EH2]